MIILVSHSLKFPKKSAHRAIPTQVQVRRARHRVQIANQPIKVFVYLHE